MAPEPSQKLYWRRLAVSVIGCLMLVTSLLAPRPAQAQFTDVANLAVNTASYIWDKALKPALEFAWKHGAAVAFKNALRTFTTQVAYDSAVMIASGGQGQTPLFTWKNLGKSASDAVDDAAGDFLETLDTENGFVRLGICQPSRIGAQLIIGATLFNEIAPRQPRCSLSDIQQNWEKFFEDPDQLLNRFGVVFDPRQNDLGVALSLQQTLIQDAATKRQLSVWEGVVNQGFKPVTEPITGFIKTPAGQISQLSQSSIEASTQSFGEFTGDIVADALGVFTNTLAARLMRRLMQGTVPSISRLQSPRFGGSGGVEYAVEINSTISTPQLVGTSDTLDIISEFSNCPPDPAYYTPVNACTITQKFAQALRKADEGAPLTVQEAIEQGYIDGGLKFALVRASDDQHAPNKAWYLSDLRKLRRARIIPLGWELAAEQFAGTPVSLQQVIGTAPRYDNGFNSTGPDGQCGTGDDVLLNGVDVSVCGMIDPNWVLRAPPAQCRIEAFGQQLEPQGSNRQKTCVDLQHCVAERADGSCQAWGYCKREQNIWRFSGASCEFPEGSGTSPWGTCQSFTNPTGRQSSYLTSSLTNYNDGTCTDAATCRWYSAARNPAATGAADTYLVNGTQADVNTVDFNLSTLTAEPRFYLKNVANRSCGSNEEGCTELLQLSNINATALGLPANATQADRVQAAVAVVTPAGSTGTYEQYASVAAATLRQAPDYLNCYDATTTNDAPECASYLALCSEAEVGCELYTPQDGSPAVPGQVAAANTCPAECVGFNSYQQKSVFFENYAAYTPPANVEPMVNFIPTTAQVCSAAAVGCEEFTNVEQNEQKEYYAELRQCVRPEDNLDNTYYTWVGSDLTGYQLKTWQLQANSPNLPHSGPFTTDVSGNGGQCGSTGHADFGINPDCKEFYDVDNSSVFVHYRYETKVIYASETCNRYRRTGGTSADCLASNGSWQNGSCFYRAIPTQGKVCSAAAVGCREYRGPTAGNVRLVFPVSTFGDTESGVSADPGPLSGWTGGTNSTESTSAFGHSLASGDDRIITKDVSGLVSQGKQYTLTFWAKRDSGAVQGGSGQTRSPWSPLASLLGAREAEAQALVVDLGTFTPTNEWAIYRLGPFTLNSVVSGGATLRVTGASKYFIDNIAFREVQDTFFVRKNSWATPSSCQIPQHLRCQQYRTRSNQPTYLTGFSSICRAEAVGCQALVDTRNSASPRALTASAGDQTVVVPADEAVFRVYDSKKACAAKFAGCRRVGEPQLSSSGEVTKWNDKFTVLDPDTFDPGQNPGLSPLCSSTQNRCQVFTDAAGVPNYFKDPQGQVCEYKLISSSVGYDWYKQGTTERCNLVANPSFELLSQGTPSDGVADEFTGWQQLAPNGGVNVLEAVASLNGQYWGSTVLRLGPVADGVVSAPFLSGANRLLAVYARVRIPTATPLSGVVNLKAQCFLPEPVDDWVDCPSLGGATRLILGPTVPRNQWLLLSQVVRTTAATSEVRLVLNAASVIGDILVDELQVVELAASLTNEQALEQAEVPYAYQCPGNQAGCTAYRDPVLTKKVYYYLNNASLNKGLCNGQVSEKEGCLLFNDLSRPALEFNAPVTYDNSRDNNNSLVSPDTTAPLDTNLVLKVRRDRTCAEWLSCQSESPRFNSQTNRYDTICYSLGACNQLGSADEGSNRCAGWLTPAQPSTPLSTVEYQSKGVDWSSQEYSGYSLPHVYPIEVLSQKDYGVLRCGGVSTGGLCTVPGSTVAPCNSTEVCSLVSSDIRLTYLNPNSNSYTCGGVVGGVSCLNLGTTCTMSGGGTSTCQYEDLGLTGSGPGESLESTSPKLCRAYPQADSPFPPGVVKDYIDSCPRDNPDCGTSGVVQIKLPSTKESVFKDANACQQGEVCECTYKRLSYSNGDILFNAATNGNVAQFYSYDAIQPGEPVNAYLRRQELSLGLKGYCLEKDPSRIINAGPDADRACLTWLPIDVVGGEISLYDYSPEAGFTDPNVAYYCSKQGAYQYGSTPFEWPYGGSSCTPEIRQGNHVKGSLVIPPGPPIYRSDIDNIYIGKMRVLDRSDCDENSGDTCDQNDLTVNGPDFCAYTSYQENQDSCASQTCSASQSSTLNNVGVLWVPGGGWSGTITGWIGFCGGHHSVIAAAPVFDQNDRLLGLNMTACGDSGSGDTPRARIDNVRIRLKRSYCSELSMVTDGVSNKAWTNRMLNPNSGFGVTVGTTGQQYTILTQTQPYSVVRGQLSGSGDIGSRVIMPLVPVQNQGSVYSFGPYTCETRPSFTCAIGNRSNICIGGSRNRQACLSTGDPCPGGGTCVGSQFPIVQDPPNVGIRLVQQLFAKLYGVFSISSTDPQYDETSPAPIELDKSSYSLGTLQPRTCRGGVNNGASCSTDANCPGDSSVPAGICFGVPEIPRVRQVDFDNFGKVFGERSASSPWSSSQGFTVVASGVTYQSGNISINSSEAVSVIFYAYNPNGEQMPLRKIYVDWGDGPEKTAGATSAYKNHKFACASPTLPDNSPNSAYNWGDDTKACVDNSSTAAAGYFSYTHVYTCVGTQSCSYKPRVFVEDNWEWCAANGWRCIGPTSNQTTPPDPTALSGGWISYPNNVAVTAQASGGNGTPGFITVAPAGPVNSCGVQGGPFSPPSRSYTITNTGSASVRWTALAVSTWLFVAPPFTGVLGPGASTTVTAFLGGNANSLPVGNHTTNIRFTNLNNGSNNPTRLFNLQVASNQSQCGLPVDN